MNFRQPFLRDLEVGRSIRLLDLLLGASVAFLILPMALVVLGTVLLWAERRPGLSDGSLVSTAPVGAGLTGFYAWIGAPFALLLGWVATRRGMMGWGHAVLAGTAVSTLAGLLLFTPAALGTGQFVTFLVVNASFLAIGGVYALVFWIGVRFVRPDLTRKNSP